jgi:cyclase
MRMMRRQRASMSRFVAVAVLALGTGPAVAQIENLAEALRTTPITEQRIADDFYVLFGVGGNMLVSIGDDGVLAVDTQYPPMVPKYRAKIEELGGGDIDFAINSHWHFDHADGDTVLGPEGTWIVAHANSREMLAKDKVVNLVTQQMEQPAYPVEALPKITFEERMSFDFNGERIDLVHFGPAHTAGDTAIIFRGHNAVHMGDVFNNRGYPFIDADSGGSLDGIIDFCRAVLDEIDTSTVVIPGHGAVADFVELADYVAMLTEIRDRVRRLIDNGATLEQIVAARPTAEWDAEQGAPASFLDRAYTSLTRP